MMRLIAPDILHVLVLALALLGTALLLGVGR